MSLTKEEQKELNELESEFGMTESEMSELSELENEFKDREDPNDFAVPGMDMLSQGDETDKLDTPSISETALAVGAQGLTLGYSDEIVAKTKSMLNGTNYEDELRDQREYIERARKANPGVALAAEMAGGAVTSIGAIAATGGTSIPALLAVGALEGGLAGVGYSENTETSDLAIDFALGSTIGVVTEGIFTGAGALTKPLIASSSRAVKKIFTNLDKSANTSRIFNKIREIGYLDAITGKHASLDDYVFSSKGKEFYSRLDTTIVEESNRIIREEQKAVWSEMSAVKARLGEIKVDASDIWEGAKKQLNELRTAGIQKKNVDKIQKEIIDIFEEEGKIISGKELDFSELTIDQLKEIKDVINEFRFQKGDDGAFLLNQKVRHQLSMLGDSLTERFNKLDPEIASINKKYSQLTRVKGKLPQKESQVKSLITDFDSSKEGVNARDIFIDLDAYDSTFSKNLYDTIEGPLQMWQLAKAANEMQLGAGTAFRILSGQALGFGAGHYLGGEQGAAIGTVLGGGAALPSIERKIVLHTISKATRDAFKIPRSLTGIFKHTDLIQSKISAISTPLAIQFNKAIHEGDQETVESMVGQALTNPAIAAEFEPGMGFEGKAVTPQEKEQVVQSIKSQRLSLSQKRKMIEEFNSTNIIPNENTQVPESNRVEKPLERAVRDRLGKKQQMY